MVKNHTVIIKIVGSQCNLRCRYCYYNGQDQSVSSVMSLEVLESFIKQHMGLFDGKLCFIWHGGEPLLAGLPLFQAIIKFQRQYLRPGQEVQNHVQTNGTLLTDDWARFFKEHEFGVGLSIDGARACHDLCRVDLAGAGSHARVMRGVNILQKHGVKFGVIQVVTPAQLPFLEDTFRFFVDELGIRQWSINVPGLGHCSNQDDSFALSNKQYVMMMIKVMRLWMERRDKGLVIRQVEDFISGAQKKKSGHCSFCGTCDRYFCLDNKGNVFPCDDLTDGPDYCFGNIMNLGLEEILFGEKRKNYLTEIALARGSCSKCRWWPVCRGGCPAQRVGGVEGKYCYCGARQELFLYAEALVQDFIGRKNVVTSGCLD
jgi:uncharacterized protein